jgi:hypothetical protein
MALLVSACGFSEPRKLIVIKENSDIDGSFLISSLIGQRLRVQHAGIVLVCCQQTLKYYDTVGKKLGYNLAMSVGRGSVETVEALRDYLDLAGDDVMERLFADISAKIKSLEGDGKKNITVVVDDITFFANLGCSEKDLVRVSMKLHSLTQTEGISVMIKAGLSDLHVTLANNVEDLADAVLTVQRLKSGDFWDVDGKLIITKVNKSGEMPTIESERKLLYFVGDHNVKLTAPGEFSLKV